MAFRLQLRTRKHPAQCVGICRRRPLRSTRKTVLGYRAPRSRRRRQLPRRALLQLQRRRPHPLPPHRRPQHQPLRPKRRRTPPWRLPTARSCPTHLPGAGAIMAYLRESFRVVRPGSSVCFHLPVPGAHLSVRQSLWWLWLRNRYKKLKRTLRLPRIMEYHRYRIPAVFHMLALTGFVDAEVRVFAMRSNRDYHSFFLARKP